MLNLLHSLAFGLWSFVFRRDFNFFDVMVFYVIWAAKLSWTQWEFWSTIIIGLIFSAIGSGIYNQWKEYHE